jgi:hypothetical protein
MERLGWEERGVVNGWQVFERFRSEGAERWDKLRFNN